MLRSINPCHELSLIDSRIYLLARALRNSSLSFSVRSSSQCASSFPFSIPPSSPIADGNEENSASMILRGAVVTRGGSNVSDR